MSKKKVVIVTGAGSGIGAATAKRFASDGFAVVLNGRTESKLQKVKDDIGGGDVLVQPGDVSKPEDVTALIEATIKAWGRIDVLVNNAAIAIFEPIDEISLEDWNRQIGINVNGPFLVTKAALPHLEKAKGAIVNVSSVSGLGGDWGGFAYNTTKGALNLMTKGLALDLAPRGIRINAVAPSLTITEMSEFVVGNDEIMREFNKRLPMQRAGTSEEVADVIAFLSSNDARFVNGAILTVDGGLNASNGQPKIG
ncbi:MAG: SDR family oxidoreductase [Pseudomonadota bacterium]